MSTSKPFSENDKLTGLNYIDWLRVIKIALTYEHLRLAITSELKEQPVNNADPELRLVYES